MDILEYLLQPQNYGNHSIIEASLLALSFFLHSMTSDMMLELIESPHADILVQCLNCVQAICSQIDHSQTIDHSGRLALFSTIHNEGPLSHQSKDMHKAVNHGIEAIKQMCHFALPEIAEFLIKIGIL